jgi:hypothetical protein
MPRGVQQQVSWLRTSVYQLRGQAPLLEERLEELSASCLQSQSRLDQLSRHELQLQRQLQALELRLHAERQEGLRLADLLANGDWLTK